MKKTLLQWGAITAICATLFVFGSCGETEYDARTDTIVTLDTPRVTAKAYPGVNYVSWEPVTGATSYTVTVRYEGGIVKTKPATENKYYIADSSDLENGKNYTYYVVANAGSSSIVEARAVYTQSSDRGEASVRAIVPPAGTKALELAAYEDGYDGEPKTVSSDDKYVLRSENIEATAVGENIVITFPMKAYLKYDVQLYNNDLPLEIITASSFDTSANDEAKTFRFKSPIENNTIGNFSFPTLNNGKQRIIITAKPVNPQFYADSDALECKTTVEIEDLHLDDAGNYAATDATARYVYNGEKFATGADKTVRVSFTPAKKDGKYVETSWYKIYCREEGGYVNTPVTATINKSVDTTSNDTKYYIDTTVSDAAKSYVYTIVVSNAGKYGKAVAATLSAELKNGINFDVHSSGYVYNSDLKPTAQKWTGSTSNTKATFTAKYLNVPSERKSSSILAKDILDGGSPVTVDKTTAGMLSIETPLAPTGKKTVLVVQGTLDGYETTNVVAY